MGFIVRTFINNAWSGTAVQPITPSIDVSEFDRFSIQIENQNTATGANLIHLGIQASNNPGDTAANLSPQWFTPNTTTLPIASALGATAGLLTIPYNNAYNFIRIEAARSATGAGLAAGTIIITLAGLQAEK